MRDLIVRVAVSDDDAASALRVISHFDALVEHGASTAAMVRAAAALAGTVAGWHDRDRATRVDATGRTLSDPAPSPDPRWPRLGLDHAQTSAVWIERAGEPGPLDRLIVERCAQALRTKLPRAGMPASPEDLTRLACESEVTDRERAEALRALGLTGPLTVVATPAPVVPRARQRCLLDGGWVALAATGAPVDAAALAPGTARLGSSAVLDGDVPGAVARARRALALSVDPTLGAPTHVAFEDLGALSTIAESLTPEAARSAPAVVELEALRARRPWVPATICAVTTESSLRRAAARLHVHHSTLQARLEWLAGALGYAPAEAEGRQRAAAAWAVWRVSGLLHESGRPHDGTGRGGD
ncbi:helix-turn-helix domain-containing protein [Agilicoccus flavus]|uniref:helix-turn-helix domain-containing protein n=1 Tax=Agilicoccus flavus TaxID=2775968 RepID=UPI001CF66051|nr:helix-turn-helix domain-containing protein [Agilicoccus flavus]